MDVNVRSVDPDSSKYLKVTDMENMFGVVQDAKGNYVYNLNETLYFEQSGALEHIVQCDCFWPLVSYNLYQTTRLAWFLMKINGVQAQNMFDKIKAGTVVKYFPMETVQDVLTRINGY